MTGFSSRGFGRTSCGRTALAAALMVTTCWAAAYAQGGKAEPIRLQFLRGHDSTMVNGRLRGDAQTEYVLGAKTDQRLTIRLTATPNASVSVRARLPTGAELPLRVESRHVWSAQLPENGDYEIWVKRTAGDRSRSQYRLTVTIR